MNFALPKIYPITDRRLTGLSHTEQVKKLIAGGARFIQLREKHAATLDFYEDAKTALEIAWKNNAKIIINDRADLALVLKADGIHLGQGDLPPAEARKILGPQAIIGFSTHNVEQALEALRMPIDYLAIGPVFATQTKENPDQTIGIKGVEKVRKTIGGVPLVAIGGLTRKNFRRVFEAGANSAAIIRSLLLPPEQIKENIQFFHDVV